jgi:glutaconate CoA-transferase subunit A
MKGNGSKLMNLKDAVGKFLFDGAHISIGGFTVNRNPMAAVHEIIRSRVRGLHMYVHSNGQGVDELIGAGCVSSIEIAYGANGRFAPTCVRFRKAVEQGTIAIEDYTNYQMTLRFLAGAMGVPFLPCRSALGTDIVNTWGFSAQKRTADPKFPDKKLEVVDNPFGQWADTSKVVLVPAIHPDVTFIHVQEADQQGTSKIMGLSFADVEQAKASKHLVITCEKLVDTETMRRHPEQNQIPGIYVDAVVHVPYGAYPTACYRYYDYDPTYLHEYFRDGQDDEQNEQNRQRYVLGLDKHEDLLDLIGKERLDRIAADPETGYAVNLKRV